MFGFFKNPKNKTCIFSSLLVLYYPILFDFITSGPPLLSAAVPQESISEEVKRMAKCEFCDKGVVFGIQVSHSHRRSNRPWKPNVKRVKAIVNGTPKHVYVCTHCLRSGKVTRAV